MSNLFHQFGVPHSRTVAYADMGRIFDQFNRMIPNGQEFSEILQSVSMDRIFLKCDISYGGLSILAFNRTGEDFQTASGESLTLDFLKQQSVSNNLICQEGLQQINVIDQLNPYSVNTVRVMTRFEGESVDVFNAFLSVGVTSPLHPYHGFTKNKHVTPRSVQRQLVVENLTSCAV